MFVSSARLQIRPSMENPGQIVGNEKSDDVSKCNGKGSVEADDAANSTPFYPSVAQRIAVWRNMTSEIDQVSVECDGVMANSATMSVPEESSKAAVNGHGNGTVPADTDVSLVEGLIAELNASRKRNKKLAMKLANVERQFQQMQIDQCLRDDRLEAMVATRVADTLNVLMVDRSPISTNTANPLLEVLPELKDGQNGGRLMGMDDWRSLMTHIRENGCQLPRELAGSYDQVQGIVHSSTTKPPTRDVGTETRKSDEEETNKETGNDQMTLALANANRELLIENAKLREQVDETQTNMVTIEEEHKQILTQLEEYKSKPVTVLDEDRDRLKEELEKTRRRYEQGEAKWEREAYELRAKYQTADEENFRLSEELKTLQRQLAHQSGDGEGDAAELVEVSERVKVLSDENSKLLSKNEELKRLVTVLRRKLSAANNTSTPITSK